MGRDIPGRWSQKERNICLGFGNFRKLFPTANKSVRNYSAEHVTDAAKKYGRVEKNSAQQKKTAGDYLKISPKTRFMSARDRSSVSLQKFRAGARVTVFQLVKL